ncbi:MAG: hypothetical protein H7039_07965 [Bryobacteraceae bacterium]|nr:hypothetical protein [Bryobacteraceae bacterium]
MFVSVTRLRLRSLLFLPQFFNLSSGSIQQAAASPGFRGGATLFDRKFTFWTITMWDGERDMKSYRGAGAHAQAMPKLAVWCSEAVVSHWNQDSAELPSWPDAHRHLMASPRWSTVRHPGKYHGQVAIREPDLAAWRNTPMPSPKLLAMP